MTGAYERTGANILRTANNCGDKKLREVYFAGDQTTSITEAHTEEESYCFHDLTPIVPASVH